MADIFDEISLEEKTPTKDIFDEIEYKETSPISEARRHVARSASRAAESIFGLPGDILRTAQLGARGLEKGAGKIREKIGLEPFESQIKKPGVPGSEELKEFSQNIFGEVVTPQNKKESLIDDIISDTAVLAVPVKGKIPFVRSLGSSVAANLATKAAEEVGVGEKGQALTKLGTFFLAGLTGKGNVKKYWNKQYKLAEEAVPSNVKVDTFGMERKIDKIERELGKGISTPSKKFVEKPLNDIRNKIKTGKVKVDELVQAKKDLNELRSKLYTEVSGKQAIKYSQGKINDLAKILDDELASYGKKNRVFFDHYKKANEAFAGFQQSKRVGNWITRNIPFGRLGKTGLIIIEGIFKPASFKYTLPAAAAFKGSELVTRMFKNPTLRRYYSNIMKAAINENQTAFLKNVKNIEKELKKEDPDIFEELARQNDADQKSN